MPSDTLSDLMWIEIRRPPRASMISVVDLFFFSLSFFSIASKSVPNCCRGTTAHSSNHSMSSIKRRVLFFFFTFFFWKSTDSPVKAVLVLGWRSTTCEMRRVLHLWDVFYTLDVGPCRGAGEASKRGPARCRRRADWEETGLASTLIMLTTKGPRPGRKKSTFG